ncbi:MAG: ABC transporter ATP-binding protein [Granulosicoccus sp.]|nr:ABC transporter ATP-binding protein [Granulosicoccus sp.]
MAVVLVSNLHKRYGSVKALDDITLQFEDGKFFGLLGPSGSGKTTLLRAIAGFVFPETGSISIGGTPVEHIPVEKRDIGMVFQNYALFPNMSVADNIGFGLRVRNVARSDEARQVNEVLDLVQLDGLGNRRPHQLSGGQRQRVALARAIVTRPKVLLLDEPLSALDKNLRVDMQLELKRIQREVGITTIFVTHDQEEALTLSDKIGVLREGQMVQTGTPREVYNTPTDEFTAKFLGEANVLSGTRESESVRLSDNTLIAAPTGSGNTVAVRPESISVNSDRQPASSLQNELQAQLRQIVFSGATATCILDWQGQVLKVSCQDDAVTSLSEGTSVWLSWPISKTIVFDNV